MTRRIGLVIVLLTVLAAVFGPWLVPYDAETQLLAQRLAGPSSGNDSNYLVAVQ